LLQAKREVLNRGSSCLEDLSKKQPRRREMKNFWSVASALVVGSLVLSGCGGGGDHNDHAQVKATISIPNVTQGTNFSFDIGAVDAANGRFYFTDRNNKSVDVIDVAANKLVKQILASGAATRARLASAQTTTNRVRTVLTSSLALRSFMSVTLTP